MMNKQSTPTKQTMSSVDDNQSPTTTILKDKHYPFLHYPTAPNTNYYYRYYFVDNNTRYFIYMCLTIPLIVFLSTVLTLRLLYPSVFTYSTTTSLVNASIVISVLELVKGMFLVVIALTLLVLFLLFTMHLNMKKNTNKKKKKKYSKRPDEMNTTASTPQNKKKYKPTNSDYYYEELAYVQEEINEASTFISEVASELCHRNPTANRIAKDAEDFKHFIEQLEIEAFGDGRDPCCCVRLIIDPMITCIEEQLKRNLFCSLVLVLMVVVSLFILTSIVLSAVIFQFGDWFVIDFQVINFVKATRAASVLFVLNTTMIISAILLAKALNNIIFKRAHKYKDHDLSCFWWFLGFSTHNDHHHEVAPVELNNQKPRFVLSKPDLSIYIDDEDAEDEEQLGMYYDHNGMLVDGRSEQQQQQQAADV